MSTKSAKRRGVSVESLEGRRLLTGNLITGHKFYDANFNGIDDDQKVVEGIQVGLDVGNDGSVDYYAYTDANGNFVFGDLDNWDLDNDPTTGSDIYPGEYFVKEILPPNSWVQTYGNDGYLVTVGEVTDVTFDGNDFGNVALGYGGARSKGFWGNKNGKALFNDNQGATEELDLLNALNLKDAGGADITFTSYDQFKSWLNTSKAKTVQHKVSVQLAAMALNVEAGLVDAGDYVYADGEFKTVQQLMDQANAALNDVNATPEDLAQFQYDLDQANNNMIFVLSDPIPVIY